MVTIEEIDARKEIVDNLKTRYLVLSNTDIDLLESIVENYGKTEKIFKYLAPFISLFGLALLFFGVFFGGIAFVILGGVIALEWMRLHLLIRLLNDGNVRSVIESLDEIPEILIIAKDKSALAQAEKAVEKVIKGDSETQELLVYTSNRMFIMDIGSELLLLLGIILLAYAYLTFSFWFFIIIGGAFLYVFLDLLNRYIDFINLS